MVLEWFDYLEFFVGALGFAKFLATSAEQKINDCNSIDFMILVKFWISCKLLKNCYLYAIWHLHLMQPVYYAQSSLEIFMDDWQYFIEKLIEYHSAYVSLD